MSEPRDRELLARYLDGLASEAEAAELARRLASDRACATAFAEASRLDAALGDHFCREKGAGNARAIIERLQAGRRMRRLVRLAAGAAAAILVVLGLALLLRPAAPPNQVLDGTVLADGAGVTGIPYGRRITVPADASATIRLGDGSSTTLDPATAAVLHGPADGLRQAVELLAGGGDFQVQKLPGRFEVRTPVGRVTVLGTEFSVRLLPAEPRDGKGEGGMKARGMLLAVAVLTGAVQVQVGERAVVLGVGQSQVFAGDEERGPRTSRIGGELTNVGADSITVVQRGDRGETSKTLAVDAQTKVVIESDQVEQVKGAGGEPTFRIKLVDGTLADLAVGRRVTVTYTQDVKATLIVLHRATPRREGGEGTEGTPRVEKPRGEGREGGSEGDTPREKPRREGGEGDAPREKPRREGGEGEREPKSTIVTGQLTRVGEGSITVAPAGDRGGEPQKFTVDSTTKVGIEGEQAEAALGDGADPVKRPKLVAGTLASLKVGQRVSVMASPEGKALRIFIFRSQKPKREGEGRDRKLFRLPEGGGDRKPPVREGGGDAPKPPVREGGGDAPKPR